MDQPLRGVLTQRLDTILFEIGRMDAALADIPRAMLDAARKARGTASRDTPRRRQRTH
jgi:hypothetical protein